MHQQKISNSSLQRIHEQLETEKSLLVEIQKALAQLNKLESIEDFLTISYEARTELTHLIQKIRELRHSRQQLRVDLAHEVSSTPHDVTIKKFIKSCKQKQSPEENPAQFDLESLRQHIARTSGNLHASASHILLKKQFVEHSLSELGINQQLERYNTMGEKVTEISGAFSDNSPNV